MLEKNFQKQVIQYLNSKRIYVLNIWGGSVYQQPGIPDLLLCYNGEFVALELKVGYNKASAKQEYHLRKIRESNGRAVILYYSPEWKSDLELFLTENIFTNNIKITNIKNN